MIPAMARLGINQYGKAETHLVRVYREGETHEMRDLHRLGRALRRPGGGAPAGRQLRGAGHRHAEEHGLRVREGAPRRARRRSSRRGSRGTSSAARSRARGCEVIEVAVDAAERSRVHAVQPRAADRAVVIAEADAHLRRLGHRRASSCSRRRTREFHGFPRDRYTTLQETTRPRARDRGRRALAPRRRRRLRDRARRADRRVRRPPQPERCSRRSTRWARPCSTPARPCTRSG